MTDEDVVARVAVLCGVKYHRSRAKKAKWKDCFTLMVRGGRALILMEKLRPLMGMRRKTQIDAAMASYDIDRMRMRYREWDDDWLLEARKTMSLRALGKKLGWSHETIRRHLKIIAA